MSRALMQQRMRQLRAQRPTSVSLPPPVGGWNTRDDPGNMPATDAQVLTNWVPGAGEIHLRAGYSQFATASASAAVQTIFEYDDGASQAMVIAAGPKVYDATGGGAATEIGDGYTNGDWIGVNFNGRAAMCNGSDRPVEIYKPEGGSLTLTTLPLSGTDGLNQFAGVHVFKTRTFFWKRNSQDFWYSAVNTLGGSLTKFPLGDVAQKGGYLMSISTWTRDGGNGPDDFAVFIMSSGEVIVYQGSDPGRSTRWALVNRYYIGRPVSAKGVAQISGGLVVITDQDYVFLPEAFATQGVGQLTKLSGAATAAVSRYGRLSGWQALFAPKEALLIFNVPIGGSGVFEQHVVNLHTRAATRFTKMNARCWGVYQGNLFFGSNGVSPGTVVVYRYAPDGITAHADVTASISAECHQAYTMLGLNNEKKVTHYRPVMSAAGDLTITTSLSYDHGAYGDEQTYALTSDGTDWGSDWGSDWAAGDASKGEWFLGYGSGNYVSLKTKISAKGKEVKWHRTDLRYERGGRV